MSIGIEGVVDPRDTRGIPVASLEHSDVPTLVIQPSHGWQAVDLSELWRYRYLLWMFLLRDVKGRYRQTLLGPLWFIIGPLIRMAVISVVLGRIVQLPSDGLPYPIFVYSGLLVWELFAGAVHRSTSSLIEYMSIISKVYFPRLIVPLAATLSGLADFAMSFVILVAMMLYFGYVPTAGIILLPLYIAVALLLALGLGLWLAALAVRFRDVQQSVGYLVQFWFYATPVAYSYAVVEEHIPSAWRGMYELNPMTQVVRGFRWALLGSGDAPGGMLVAILLAAAVAFGGAVLFRRTERNVVDLL